MADKIKVFKKRGLPNHQQRKMIKELQDFFGANPDKAEGFEPATDDEGLKKLHSTYCAEEVAFVETKNDGTTTTHTPEEEPEPTHQNFRDSLEPEAEYEEQMDPMNREQPKIRDYVLDEGFDRDPKTGTPPPSSTYEEPTSFKDSFEIPDDTIQPDGKQQQQGPINSQPPKPKTHTPPDPDAKVKRKSKKKFTKYAVDAVCALAGRGITYWATKDITDAALQKAIVEDELSKASLDYLVFLDHNTQGTVKQFFELQIASVQELANFTADEKEDLAEALEDFMEYKKIEINPTINLAVIFAGMVFERILKAMQSRAETGSILTQLKTMHAAGIEGPPRNDMPDPADQDTTNTADPASAEPVAEVEPEKTEAE